VRINPHFLLLAAFVWRILQRFVVSAGNVIEATAKKRKVAPLNPAPFERKRNVRVVRLELVRHLPTSIQAAHLSTWCTRGSISPVFQN
jgi:hypothetical protein